MRSAMRSTSLVVVILYAIEHFQCSSACFRISNTIMFPLRASGIALDWFPIIIFEPTVAIGYSDSVSGNRDQHFTSQPVNDRHGGIDCWISLYTSPILISQYLLNIPLNLPFLFLFNLLTHLPHIRLTFSKTCAFPYHI